MLRHGTALVESKAIGRGTRIWAFTHVMKGAVIGRNCNIGDHCYIESRARVGDDVTVKNGIAIWDGVTIERGVFLGPFVVFTNDLVPRSRAEWRLSPTVVEEGATIGANATVLCGLRVGAYSFVGAASVVTKSVPPYALVYGNPARVRGYVCRCGAKLHRTAGRLRCSRCGQAYARRGARVVPSPRVK